MAQSQPMGGGSMQTAGQSQPLSNVLYDLVTVMSNCGQAVQALGDYIADARKDNDPDIIDLFEKLRQDEIQHCTMTRDVLDKFVCQGKF